MRRVMMSPLGARYQTALVATSASNSLPVSPRRRDRPGGIGSILQDNSSLFQFLISHLYHGTYSETRAGHDEGRAFNEPTINFRIP